MEKNVRRSVALRTLAFTWASCTFVSCVLGIGSGVAQDSNPLNRTDAKKPVALPGLQQSGAVLLPNGWSLQPAGKQLVVGDFPVNAAMTSDGKYALVLHAGYGEHQIQVINLETMSRVSAVKLDQTFFGLQLIAGDTKVVASGAEDEVLHVFDFAKGYLSNPVTLRVAGAKERWVVSGLTNRYADASRPTEILVCGLLANELATIDLDAASVRTKVRLPADSFPYAVIPTADGKMAYVSLWGKAAIAEVDLEKNEVRRILEAASHPTEMAFLDQEQVLVVACSDDNSVRMIRLADGKTLEVIKTSLFPKAPNGSTTASMAISPDGKVLVAANADNNNLAVFDISERGKSHSLGFIPTGWYPTSVRFSQDGSHWFVTNGKGQSSKSNRAGPSPLKKEQATIREYIGGLMQGTVSYIPVPSPAQMATLTKTAFSCSPLTENLQKHGVVRSDDNPIPDKVGDPSPIKHCLYIIKENRTYDQVLGDLPQGNGDPSLCIFPEKVTPNQHALAREFVLLDNFYVESEVSADGHEWTMAAYATDFVEKTWPLTYRGGKGKLSYPSEGNFKIAQPSSGYFWDRCKEKGKSYFSFGEFIANGPTPDSPAVAKVESLEGHFDPKFRSYDLDYSDIKRADRFLERWGQFEKEGNLPSFIVLRLPNDHTYGTRVGKPTPTAMVAENDLALGMIIEGISNSPSWKETAIFVIEDDAQNGADHVDAHRTIAFAISPYIRRGTVDSTLYSTASMLRSMGLILGLEPLSQFDAAANPMYASFQAKPDLTPYQHRNANVDITAKNIAGAFGAELSEKLDLSKEDAADDLLFGDIVWRSVKGADHPMPAPVRAAFVFAEVEEEEGEDEE